MYFTLFYETEIFMQARYVHNGNAIDYMPTTAVAAGQIIAFGDMIGIARLDIPANTLGALAVTGVYDVVKGDAAFNPGDAVYWNAVDFIAVTAGTGNPLLGRAVVASSSSDPTVRVKLASAVG